MKCTLPSNRAGHPGPVEVGNIILKKTPKKLYLAGWKAVAEFAFAKLGYSSVNKFIDDMRGDDHRMLCDSVSAKNWAKSRFSTRGQSPADSDDVNGPFRRDVNKSERSDAGTCNDA